MLRGFLVGSLTLLAVTPAWGGSMTLQAPVNEPWPISQRCAILAAHPGTQAYLNCPAVELNTKGGAPNTIPGTASQHEQIDLGTRSRSDARPQTPPARD